MIEDGAIDPRFVSARPGARHQGSLPRSRRARRRLVALENGTQMTAVELQSEYLDDGAQRYLGLERPWTSSHPRRRSRSGSDVMEGARAATRWSSRLEHRLGRSKKALIEGFMERKNLDWQSSAGTACSISSTTTLARTRGSTTCSSARGGWSASSPTTRSTSAVYHAAGRHPRLLPRRVPAALSLGEVFGVNWDSISFEIDRRAHQACHDGGASSKARTRALVQDLLDELLPTQSRARSRELAGLGPRKAGPSPPTAERDR